MKFWEPDLLLGIAFETGKPVAIDDFIGSPGS